MSTIVHARVVEHLQRLRLGFVASDSSDRPVSARPMSRSRSAARPSRPGHSVLFTSATALLAAFAKAESEGQLADRLLFYAKPTVLVIDELGYLPQVP
jgi:hypothetical protein